MLSSQSDHRIRRREPITAHYHISSSQPPNSRPAKFSHKIRKIRINFIRTNTVQISRIHSNVMVTYKSVLVVCTASHYYLVLLITYVYNYSTEAETFIGRNKYQECQTCVCDAYAPLDFCKINFFYKKF